MTLFSDTTTTLLTALLEAKQEFGPIVRNAQGQVGGSRNYKYADLDAVLDAVDPILHKHGLLLLQPVTVEGGEQVVVTRIVHAASGEYVSSAWRLVSAKEDSQSYGSALTYGRRYAVLSLLGLAPEDDDGAEASRRAPERPATPPRNFLNEVSDANTLDKLAAVQRAAAAAGEWIAGSELEAAVLKRKAELEQDKAAESGEAASPSGS